MRGWKKVNEYERRAVVALMQRTTMTDREIAELLGRGLWTVFHIRKAAGIPATNKGRAAGVSRPEAEPVAPDIRSHWLSVDPSLRGA